MVPHATLLAGCCARKNPDWCTNWVSHLASRGLHVRLNPAILDLPDNRSAAHSSALSLALLL